MTQVVWPPICCQSTDVALVHKRLPGPGLGPSQDREGRPRVRPVTVRFRTERLRDSVYRARTRLKEHNKNHRDAVFINEDLTQRRAAMAYQTRKLKAAQKISDCWTYNGIVVVKERNNTIKKVNAPHDLDIYQ